MYCAEIIDVKAIFQHIHCHLFLFMAGYEFDYIFDWTIIKFQQAQKHRNQPRLSVNTLILFSY